MSRHRDVRNMTKYNDYDLDDDDYDEQGAGSYGGDAAHSPASSSFLYQRPGVPSADVAAQHHREQLAAAARAKHPDAAAPPRATANSAAFFKTKPAKKKGGSTASAAAAAGATSANATTAARNQREQAGSEELFGGDDFDAETAAAIEASLRDAKAQEAFLAEAGLAPSASPVPSASPPVSASPAAPFSRSQTDQEATRAAIEQLRMDKQRQAAGAGGGGGSSATSTPKRPLGNDPMQRSASLNSFSSASSVAATPLASPVKIDRPNLPVPTRISITPASNNTLQAPGAGSGGGDLSATGSQPATPSRSPTSSPPLSASAGPVELPDIAPPQTSAKRAREVNAVLSSEAEGSSAKGRLNMIAIGHVDAGKSTLMGHLLFLQGRVSKKLLHRYEKESKEQGKSSFHFAWVLDETDEERARGVTTDVATNFFSTASKKITLLDAPGHREFIPNMITGAAQADAAILVVPATRGEFEGGFSDDGQIREHAVLARSLGVSQLILAVNKLDSVGWSKERYDEIVGQMLPYLRSVGYKEKEVWHCPVSGLTGENIMERKEPALREWYDGPVLLDLIDNFSLPPRHEDRPMRMCVQDVFRTLSLGQAVAGKVECGTVLPRDRLLLLPLGETVTVKSMESRGEMINIARAGDNIEMGIRDFSDPAVLQIGQWLCDPLHPIPMVTHFRAQIITMNYKVPLLAGTQLLFLTQAAAEPVTLLSLQSLVDKVTGAVTKRNPRVVPKQSTAIVEITSRNRICLELFRNYRELGRFTLRRGTETVAVGVVTKLYRMRG